MAKVNEKETNYRIVNILKGEGVSESDTVIMADVMTDAEIKGIKTHGYVRVKRYVDYIRSGGIMLEWNIKIVTDTPSRAMVDGYGRPGIIIASKADDLAIRKAKETVVNVKNSLSKKKI